MRSTASACERNKQELEIEERISYQISYIHQCCDPGKPRGAADSRTYNHPRTPFLALYSRPNSVGPCWNLHWNQFLPLAGTLRHRPGVETSVVQRRVITPGPNSINSRHHNPLSATCCTSTRIPTTRIHLILLQTPTAQRLHFQNRRRLPRCHLLVPVRKEFISSPAS